MRRRRNSKAFEIALSAISTAFAALGLLFGFFVPYMIATGYMIAVIAMMVPLSRQLYIGSFLAYIGTCILAVILGAVARIWDLLPFVIFFGLHPMANSLQIRFKVNRWLALAIKAVWFIGMLFAVYFMALRGLIGTHIFQTDLYKAVQKYIYVLIPAAGAALFIIYDYLIFKCQIAINLLVYRIKK